MLSKSTYFSFKKKLTVNKKLKIEQFKGWSGLSVSKISIPKKFELKNDQINKNFPKLIGKEKIFLFINDNIKFKHGKKIEEIKKYDAIVMATNDEYAFFSLKNSHFFMIASTKSKTYNDKIKHFNFLNDIKSKNLWGGKIISRPYGSKNLTLVLFDLKPGFKFEDKGHKNEQITWIIKGKMDFYSNSISNRLDKNTCVSIGSHHVHGGTSRGAIGFYAFYPKRKEKKYIKN